MPMKLCQYPTNLQPIIVSFNPAKQIVYKIKVSIQIKSQFPFVLFLFVFVLFCDCEIACCDFFFGLNCECAKKNCIFFVRQHTCTHSLKDRLFIRDIWVWDDLTHVTVLHERISLCVENYKYELWDQKFECKFYFLIWFQIF